MCKTGKQITFCTCKNEPKQIVHHKKSKRWRQKNPLAFAYVWTLSRFSEYFDSMMEGLMMEASDKLGEELTKEFVLEELNSRNCFDFEYIPHEGDCLSIHANNHWDFLSFIYREGVWVADQYDCFYVRTEKMEEGKLLIEEK